MRRWLRRFIGGSPDTPRSGAAAVPPNSGLSSAGPSTLPSVAALAGASADSALPHDGAVDIALDDPRPRFVEWLLDLGPTRDEFASADERRLLARLDALLDAQADLGQLLPRTPAVIPQLLSTLRQDGASVELLAQRVARDPHLVAEAIRMANGAGVRGVDPVATLPEAIRRIGLAGLQRVIARVLVRPVFDAAPDTLSARAAPRLWAHSELQAEHCMALARAAGVDAFDGYLAGLVHNTGWTVLLRMLDRGALVLPAALTRGCGDALELRRERLFAMLAARWSLSPAIDALAAERLDERPAALRGPLAACLAEADRVAARQVLAEAGAG